MVSVVCGVTFLFSMIPRERTSILLDEMLVTIPSFAVSSAGSEAVLPLGVVMKLPKTPTPHTDSDWQVTYFQLSGVNP